MESREEEQEEDSPRSLTDITAHTSDTTSTEDTTTTTTSTTDTSTTTAATGSTPADLPEDEEEEEEEEDEEEEVRGRCVAMAAAGADAAGLEDSEQRSWTLAAERPAPPSSLALSQPTKKKVLVAPPLSLSLGGSVSTLSDDFPSAFLSPPPDDDDVTGLDFDLDAMETPSDSESLHLPAYDLDLGDDLRRLGVASSGPGPGSRGAGPGAVEQEDVVDAQGTRGAGPGSRGAGPGAVEQEDVVDAQGTRWRCFFSGGEQQSRVNMSVLQPFLRVLSHGGYHGDGMSDIIVFSSCYLPQSSLENYEYVMEHLFRYVVGTLELMVSEDYVLVYLCAGGQREKLPGISWLRECYTTINYRLRKNLKRFYVVHPTWYIKALITVIKPFISSKFSRKLFLVDSLQVLSQLLPTEQILVPDCVSQFDQQLSR